MARPSQRARWPPSRQCTPPGPSHPLSIDQALAVEQIATSGRRLDVLVGPAGTGKSTTMAGLRAAWEAEHGAGSVLGLAPSAAAAEVLAEQLGIDTENTAKWLHEHRQEAERLVKIADLRASAALSRERRGIDPLCTRNWSGPKKKWPDGSFGRASW